MDTIRRAKHMADKTFGWRCPDRDAPSEFVLLPLGAQDERMNDLNRVYKGFLDRSLRFKIEGWGEAVCPAMECSPFGDLL